MLRPWLFEKASIHVHRCMLVVRQISPLYILFNPPSAGESPKRAGEKKPSQIGSAW